MIFCLGKKKCVVKNKKWIEFPESRYVNSNPVSAVSQVSVEAASEEPKVLYIPGLSMNILHAGSQSSVQRGFFKNSMGNLLPTIRFLVGLYNFCNFAIIFSLL